MGKYPKVLKTPCFLGGSGGCISRTRGGRFRGVREAPRPGDPVLHQGGSDPKKWGVRLGVVLGGRRGDARTGGCTRTGLASPTGGLRGDGVVTRSRGGQRHEHARVLRSSNTHSCESSARVVTPCRGPLGPGRTLGLVLGEPT